MTKEELQEYRAIKVELQNLESLYKRLTRGGSSSLQARYDQIVERLQGELAHIESVIESLKPIERTLMRLRYIEGKSWRAISLRIGYSEPQTYRTHAIALKKVRKL